MREVRKGCWELRGGLERCWVTEIVNDREFTWGKTKGWSPLTLLCILYLFLRLSKWRLPLLRLSVRGRRISIWNSKRPVANLILYFKQSRGHTKGSMEIQIKSKVYLFLKKQSPKHTKGSMEIQIKSKVYLFLNKQSPEHTKGSMEIQIKSAPPETGENEQETTQ